MYNDSFFNNIEGNILNGKLHQPSRLDDKRYSFCVVKFKISLSIILKCTYFLEKALETIHP